MVQRRKLFRCQVKKLLMKKPLLIVALFFSVLSCSKKADTPLPENLQEKIRQTDDCTCQPYLNLYQWKGQLVYLWASAGPACNSVPSYFDKDGNPLMMIAIYTMEQFLAESKLIKTIWRC